MPAILKGRQVRLCKECPVCVNAPVAASKAQTVLPYCIPGKRFLPAKVKRDTSCPLAGRTYTWPK
jgi:hypothetical protein